MEEYQYLPGDGDGVSELIPLESGTAALLYMKGSRPSQQDALWAGAYEGKLVVCSSDGVFSSMKGDEMAKWVVEFGRKNVLAQIKEAGRVDVIGMQHAIREGINQKNSMHTGQATSLCMVIDGNLVSAHRVGDPDFRIDYDFLTEPALAPESHSFSLFRSWWENAGRAADPFEVLSRLGCEQGRLLFDGESSNGGKLINCHTGLDTDISEALISPFKAERVLRTKQRLVAGTDGLQNKNLHGWYQAELPSASDPKSFLTSLWDKLERCRGENASGVAFFCDR